MSVEESQQEIIKEQDSKLAELEEIIDGRYEKHMAMIQRIAELDRQVTVGKEDRSHLYWKAKELEKKMQIMWEWCDHSKTPNEWYDWFDSDGVQVSKEIDK